ncbi:MAG TPA: SDR family oxidoreductase [Sporichthyaceae bacterium]|jgi:NAD(P)-dependent dehydrogenase (short-subunit alcohol dehydrogenase family)
MELQDAVVIVTGAAGGIGAALVRAALDRGASGVVAADLDAAGLPAKSDRVMPVRTDVGELASWESMVGLAHARFGRVDVVFSNAGLEVAGGAELPAEVWNQHWRVNVLAHAHAARAVFPRMSTRGSGHLVITGSAASMLADLASAPYTATKHAALGLAQWLAISHWDEGIRVSCWCPNAVATPMIDSAFGYRPDMVAAGYAPAEVQSPDFVVGALLADLAEDHFLILPDPEVAIFAQRKAADPERWLAGMRRFRSHVLELQGELDAGSE